MLEFWICIKDIPVKGEDDCVVVRIGGLVPPRSAAENAEAYKVCPTAAFREEFASPLIQQLVFVQDYRAVRLV